MEGQQSNDSVKPKFHLHNSKMEVYAENAIKKSNVKSFINQGSRISDRLNLENNQSSNLSQHLLHLKQSCSELKKDISDKENQTVKMRDETCFKSEKVRQIQTEKEGLEQKIGQLKRDVEQVHMKKESTFHGFKTYEHILWRMKKDEITNQIRKNALQKQLGSMEKELRELENRLYSLGEHEELCSKGVRQAQEEIAKEGSRRERKLGEIGQALQEKKVSQLKKQERDSQTNAIQEMAAGDLQDAELIRIKKFLQVQVFLKGVLKGKMQRLKEFYEPYELAFFQIKSQTSAKEASALKSEFFNFEAQYQEKTSWIKHLEEETNELERERKALTEELLRARDSELDLLEEMEDKSYPQSEESGPLDSREHLTQRSVECELMAMKVKEWANYQNKLLNKSFAGVAASDEATKEAKLESICDFLIARAPSAVKAAQ